MLERTDAYLCTSGKVFRLEIPDVPADVKLPVRKTCSRREHDREHPGYEDECIVKPKRSCALGYAQMKS